MNSQLIEQIKEKFSLYFKGLNVMQPYIPRNVSRTEAKSEPFDKALLNFISNNKRVLLVRDEPGLGTTTCFQQFILNHWDEIVATGYIPLFISLSEIEQPETQLIEKCLSRFDIPLEVAQSAQQKFLFIFEEYEAVYPQVNLYASNRLQTWHAKFIFTCHREYLSLVDHQLYFVPFFNERPLREQFAEIELEPLTEQEITEYIERVQPTTGSQYLQTLQTLPGLWAFLKIPFFLDFIITLLPQQVNNPAVLYKMLIDKWVEHYQQKFKRYPHFPADLVFKDAYWQYAADLAARMQEQQTTRITYQATADLFSEEATDPWQSFFASDYLTQLMRSLILRSEPRRHYTFIDPALIPIYASYDKPSKKSGQIVTSPIILPPETPPPKKQKQESIHFSLLNNFLNQHNLLLQKDLLLFLSERVHTDRRFKDFLFEMVMATKKHSDIITGAVNAISILCLAKEPLTNYDFSYIQTPGAILKKANFESSNLSHANLAGADLEAACLRNVDVSHTNFTGAQFGLQQNTQLGVPGEFGNMHRVTKAIIYHYETGQLIIKLKNDVKIWDIQQGQLLWTLNPKEMPEIEAIAISANGVRLMVTGTEKVEVWDLKTRALLFHFTIGKEAINAYNQQPLSSNQKASLMNVCHSEGGPANRVSCASVFEINKGELINKFIFSAGSYDKFLMHPSEEVLIVAENQIDFPGNMVYLKRIFFLDVKTREEIGESIELENQQFLDFCLSDDAHFLILLGLAGKIQVWVQQAPLHYSLENTFDFEERPSKQNIYFNRQNTLLAIYASKKIVLYDLRQQRVLQRWEEHKYEITCLAFNTAGNRLVSGSIDQNVVLWDMNQKESIARMSVHRGDIEFVAFLNEQDDVLTIDQTGINFIWRSQLASQYTFVPHKKTVRQLGFHAQKKLLVSLSEDGQLCTWDAASGNLLRRTKIDLESKDYDRMCLTTDGSLLLSSQGQNLQLWDVSTGYLLETYPVEGDISRFKFSGTEKKVGIITTQQVYILDLNHKQLVAFGKNNNDVQNLYFSPDDQYLVLLANEKLNCLQIWDFKQKQYLYEIVLDHTKITAVTIAPFDNVLTVGTEYGELYFYDIQDGRQKSQMQVAEGSLYELIYSPDNQYLACGKVEKTSFKQLILFDLSNRNDKKFLPYCVSTTWNSTNKLFICSGYLGRSTPYVGFWDLTQGSAIKSSISANLSYCLKFLTDDSLAIADINGDVAVWRYTRGLIRKQWELVWSNRHSFYADGCQLLETTGLSAALKAMLLSDQFQGQLSAWTALHYAVAGNRIEDTKRLLSASAPDVNATGLDQTTALHLAAEHGLIEMAQLLIAQKASLTIKNKDGFMPLHTAVNFNHIAFVRFLLEIDKTLVSTKVNNGQTPLHIAVINKNEEMCSLLLQYGAEVNIEDGNKVTPLIQSARVGSLAICQLLLANSADIFAVDDGGYTVLHTAVAMCHIGMAQLFLAEEKLLCARAAHGYTLLHIAVSGSQEMLQLLLDHSIDKEAINDWRATPLHLATESGYASAVETLVKAGANVHAKNKLQKTALEIAIREGYARIAFYLLQRMKPSTELAIACFNSYLNSRFGKNCYAVFSVLLNEGFAKFLALDNQWQFLMQTLIKKGWLKELKLLITLDNRPHLITIESVWVLFSSEFMNNMSTLQKSEFEEREKQRLAFLQLLISAGLDVNQRHLTYDQSVLETVLFSGEFPQITAALIHQYKDMPVDLLRIFTKVLYFRKKEEALDHLKTYGFEINVQASNALGQTALHIAAANGDVAGTRWLIQEGANLAAKDQNGCTPLHLAALNRKPATVASLLKASKTELAAENNNGLTPLFLALSQLNEVATFADSGEVIASFIKNGFDLKATNKNGLTALQFVIFMASQTKNRFLYDEILTNRYALVIDRLFKYGANKEDRYEGLTLFLMLIRMGSLTLTPFLIKRGVDILATTTEGYAFGSGLLAIHVATLHKNISVLQFLTTNNFRIDDFDAEGMPLMHRVIRSSAMHTNLKFEFIDFLLQNGANIEAKDKNGLTPFDVAAFFGDLRLFSSIVWQVQQKNPSPPVERALQLALQHCDALMAELLDKPEKPLAPLMDAIEIVKRLNATNSDVYIKLARFYRQIAIRKNRQDKDYHSIAFNTYSQLIYSNQGNLTANIYAEAAYFASLLNRPYDVMNHAAQAISSAQDQFMVSFSKKEKEILCEELQVEIDFWQTLNIPARVLAYSALINTSRNTPDDVSQKLVDFSKLAGTLNDPTVYVLLGHCFRKRKLYHQASVSYETASAIYQATETKPVYSSAQHYLLAMKEMPRTRDNATPGEKFTIEQLENYFNYFTVLDFATQEKEDMQIKEAVADCNKAIKILPNDPRGYFLRTEVRSCWKDKKELIEEINQSVRENIFDAFNYHDRGDAFSALGNFDEAKADFDKAITLNPNVGYFFRARGGVLIEFYQFQNGIKDYDIAIKAFAIALDFNNRGYCKSALGYYTAALQDFSIAKELDPHLIAARKNIALFSAMLGNYESALEEAALALSIVQSEYPRAEAMVYFAFAAVKRLMGNYAEARQDIEKAIELFPLKQGRTYQEYCQLRAEIQIQQGQYQEACQSLQIIVQENLNALAAALYGFALCQIGDEQQAHHYLNVALTTNKIIYSDFCLLWIGKLHFALNEKEKAFVSVSNAIRLNPKGTFHYVTRAEMAMALEKYTQASEDYRFLQECDPDNAEWKNKCIEATQKLLLQQQIVEGSPTHFQPRKEEQQEKLVDKNTTQNDMKLN